MEGKKISTNINTIFFKKKTDDFPFSPFIRFYFHSRRTKLFTAKEKTEIQSEKNRD